MRTAVWRRGIVALGCSGFWACGDDEHRPVVGDACETPTPVVCGHEASRSNPPGAILTCVDGAWVIGHNCPGSETCFDDDAHGAPACTDVNAWIPYAEIGVPCDAEGGAACSFDLELLLTCSEREWTSDRSCAQDATECGTRREGEGDCTDPDGCITCL